MLGALLELGMTAGKPHPPGQLWIQRALPGKHGLSTELQGTFPRARGLSQLTSSETYTHT